MRKLKQSQLRAYREDKASKQNNRCAICKTIITPEMQVMDHNHTTGVLRDVLCRNCNGMEGKIKNLANRGKRIHTPEWYLQQIIAYWEKHSTPQSDLMYPTHKTDEDKRLLRNKRARLKRAKAKE